MRKFIKDVVNGEIFIDPADIFIKELLETKEMKRLINIYQLGECHNVFYSATNNRYSHSIGVYYNAKRYVEGLNAKTPHKDYQCIIAAALLHDIGHGPRSHCFEIFADFNHERMTTRIISDASTDVNKVLTKHKIDIKAIIQIIEKRHPIKYYNQIISSQIDADRLDYLCRDSYFVGAKYGNIEPGIIFQWCEVIDNQIVFDHKAINLIEDVLFSRWQMFKQIYCNRKVVVYEYLLRKAFAQYKKLALAHYKFIDQHKLYSLLDPYVHNHEWDLASFNRLDENALHLIIVSWNQENDPILKAFTDSYLYDNKYECGDHDFIEQHPGLSYDEFDYKICLYNEQEPILINHNGVVKNITAFSTFLISNSVNNVWKNTYYFYKKSNS